MNSRSIGCELTNKKNYLVPVFPILVVHAVSWMLLLIVFLHIFSFCGICLESSRCCLLSVDIFNFHSIRSLHAWGQHAMSD